MISLRKRWLAVGVAAARLLLVVAPSAPAFAVPGGTVTGHVLDNGAPVVGVSVRLQATVRWSSS